MKKAIIMAALALASATSLYALDEEFMTITLKDGKTATYNVADVEKVEFTQVHTDEAFTVTPAGGQTEGFLTIPSMLRVKAVETGDPTQFAFGTVEAATADGLCQGKYAVWLTVSAAKIYNGEFDLAESADSYVLKLIEYTDGDPVVREKVVSGKLSTSVNSKNQRVTIALDAVFDDGTAVTANYTGLPADVESLEAVIPAKQYGNEVYYYDMDGNEFKSAVESVRKSYSSYSGKTTFYFYLENDLNSSGDARFIMDADMLAKFEAGQSYTVAMNETPGWEFRLGSIQLYCSPDSDSSKDYKNQADNGTLTITVGADGSSYEFFIDITNSYTNNSGEHSDPQRVILNYKGTF